VDYSWQLKFKDRRPHYTLRLNPKSQLLLKRTALGLFGLDAFLLFALMLSGHPFAMSL